MIRKQLRLTVIGADPDGSRTVLEIVDPYQGRDGAFSPSGSYRQRRMSKRNWKRRFYRLFGPGIVIEKQHFIVCDGVAA